MAMLCQLSYNGAMIVLPMTYSGTEQVLIDLARPSLWPRLAILTTFEEDPVFTINLARS